MTLESASHFQAGPPLAWEREYGRGVAQPGSAFGSGPKGRRFKSSRPDHNP